MVVNVQTRHIKRPNPVQGRGQEERTEVVGSLSIVGGQTSYPAGSLGLRTISEMILFPKVQGQRRGIFGSVSSPNILGNGVLLRPVVSGTTGTRLASLATIGSVAPTGTAYCSFLAVGY